jgi:O-antigen ligase
MFKEQDSRTSALAAWGMIFLMVFPWLEPWALAPQTNTVPLLVSWASVGLLLVFAVRIRPQDVARAWAWAALISSGIGLLQYFGLASAFGPWVHVPDHLGEAMANLRQRNQLATLMGIGVLSVLWWQAQGLKAWHAVWMLAFLALGNAATGSRTGLLHMVLICALVLAWSMHQRSSRASGHAQWSWRLALWALGVYLVASWFLPLLLAHTSGQEAAGAVARMGNNEGCGSRRVLWGNVLQLIGQKPWLGWGWGELKYAHYMASYPGDRFCDILGNAHNLPLHLAVTLGVPAAVLIVTALLAWIIWMRPWRCRELHQQLAWSVLALIGLHSLLEFPLWYGPFQMAVLLCLGLLVTRSRDGTLNVSGGMRYVGVAVLAIVSFVAVDYLRVRQIYVPAPERLSVWRDPALATAKGSVLFGQSAAFAELTLTPVTQENAAWVLQTSQDMLHYSPEPRVIHRLIDSAQLLGQQTLAREHQQRMRQAFPNE